MPSTVPGSSWMLETQELCGNKEKRDGHTVPALEELSAGLAKTQPDQKAEWRLSSRSARALTVQRENDQIQPGEWRRAFLQGVAFAKGPEGWGTGCTTERGQHGLPMFHQA